MAWPNPRFTDNGDGTIADNLTGLVWLRNGNCTGVARTWQQALDDVAELNTVGTMNGNVCGDTSNGGVHQTDWRLPNIRELASLYDYGSNAAVLLAGHGFLNINGSYWSSTTKSGSSLSAWFLDLIGSSASVRNTLKGSVAGWVIAVRGGI